MRNQCPYQLLCLTIVLVAHAPVTEASFYAGTAVLFSHSDLERLFTETTSDEHVGYKLDLGYDFNKYLAVQLAYQDFGPFDSGWKTRPSFEGPILERVRLESQSLAVSVIAKWPFAQRFNLLAEVGAEKWEIDYDVKLQDPFGPPGYTFNSDDEDIFVSVGVSYDIADDWGVSLKYYYRKQDTELNLDTLEHKTVAAWFYFKF